LLSRHAIHCTQLRSIPILVFDFDARVTADEWCFWFRRVAKSLCRISYCVFQNRQQLGIDMNGSHEKK